MKFSRISITKKGVELAYERKDEHKSEETVARSPERPLPAFADALQAFTPFVVNLLEIPDEWSGNLTITTLNLSEDKNGNRGLIVTATRPVPKAYDRPLVLNTPLVREGSEDASEEACTLSDEVLELIKLVESEAVRYLNGEREQLELLAKSDNASDFDERAAAAEVASTRKPRGKKKDAVLGVGTVANPDATMTPTDDVLRQLLLSVERDVPVDAIRTWTSGERDAAQRYATRRQKEIIGELPVDPQAVEPPHIQRDATLPLDGWTGPKLLKSDVNVDEVRAAVESGE